MILSLLVNAGRTLAHDGCSVSSYYCSANMYACMCMGIDLFLFYFLCLCQDYEQDDDAMLAAALSASLNHN